MSAAVKTKPRVPELRFPEFGGQQFSNSELSYLAVPKGLQTGPFGSQLKAAEYNFEDGSIPVVMPRDIADGRITSGQVARVPPAKAEELKRHRLVIGDIVFPRRGELGRIAITTIDEDGWLCGTGCLRMRPDTSKTCPNYLRFAFQRKRTVFWLESNAVGQTMLNLNTDILGGMPVSIPSLPEQKKIASFLGAVDGKLGVLRGKHAALERFKRGLMQKLFSRTLRFTHQNGTPYPDWEEKRLGDIAKEKLSNGVFNDPAKVGSGYRLINVKDMYSDATIDPSGLNRVAIDESEFLSNKAEWGDVFFTRSSLVKEGIAHSNVFLSRAEDVTFDGHLIRLKPDLSIIVPKFLYYCLGSDTMRRQFVARGKTGTMTTIGQADVISVRIEVPYPEEQQKIADALSAMDAKITAVADQIARLETFKRGLLQKMFV